MVGILRQTPLNRIKVKASVADGQNVLLDPPCNAAISVRRSKMERANGSKSIATTSENRASHSIGRV